MQQFMIQSLQLLRGVIIFLYTQPNYRQIISLSLTFHRLYIKSFNFT